MNPTPVQNQFYKYNVNGKTYADVLPGAAPANSGYSSIGFDEFKTIAQNPDNYWKDKNDTQWNQFMADPTAAAAINAAMNGGTSNSNYSTVNGVLTANSSIASDTANKAGVANGTLRDLGNGTYIPSGSAGDKNLLNPVNQPTELLPSNLQAQTQALKSSYTGPSIVDFLTSTNQPNDYASRARLAQQNGIQNYTGTADQNTQLLNLLRGNSQANGTGMPPTTTGGSSTTSNTSNTPTSTTGTNTGTDYTSEITKEMQPGADETAIQSQLAALEASRKKSYVDAEGQPIATPFITGQEAAVDKSLNLDKQTLQDKLALLQSKRQSALDVSKFQLERQDKAKESANKNADTSVVEVNGRKILIDNKTGKTVQDLGAATKASTTTTKSTQAEIQTQGFQTINQLLGMKDAKGVPYTDAQGYFTAQGFKTLIDNSITDGITRKEFLDQYASKLSPTGAAAYGLTEKEKADYGIK